MTWTVRAEGSTALVQLRGRVTEAADLDSLGAELAGVEAVRFDLGDVSGINSAGVRRWIEFVRGLEPLDVQLDRCSPPIVDQLNTVADFAGGATVLRIQAPYACPSCESELAQDVDVSEWRSALSRTPLCERCSVAMEFDDLEAAYFAFAAQLETREGQSHK